jgi:hypothetical protein
MELVSRTEGFPGGELAAFLLHTCDVYLKLNVNIARFFINWIGCHVFAESVTAAFPCFMNIGLIDS